jgi:hypothetical protein
MAIITGVGVETALRVRDAYQLEELDRAFPGGSFAEPRVRRKRERELVADAIERIERGHRLLEDHRELRTAVAIELAG